MHKRKPLNDDGMNDISSYTFTHYDMNKSPKRRKVKNQKLIIMNDGNNMTSQALNKNQSLIENHHSVRQQKNRGRDIIIADSLSQLPKSCIEKLIKTDISLKLFENYWEITLNILRFKTKQNFCTSSQFKNNEIIQRQSYFVPKEEDIMNLMTRNFNLNQYSSLEVIGKGGYGKVYSALSEYDQCRVAIKKVPHESSKQRRKNFIEINTLLSCKSHPNIIRIIRSHLKDKEVWIVTDLVNGLTLSQASKIKQFTEEQIAYIANKILKAIHFLHSNNIVHRDIKGSNILIDNKANVKIIDFGLCWNMKVYGESRNMVGSPFWMAPEMIRREYHSSPADIWSFGICLMELINQHPPNKKSSIRAMFISSTVGYPDPFESSGYLWSNEMKHFMSKCLNVDPNKRWRADQLLSHSWLKKRSSKREMEELFNNICMIHELKKNQKDTDHQNQNDVKINGNINNTNINITNE